jgi:hypothetical protein
MDPYTNRFEEVQSPEKNEKPKYLTMTNEPDSALFIPKSSVETEYSPLDHNYIPTTNEASVHLSENNSSEKNPPEYFTSLYAGTGDIIEKDSSSST